jgi:hypothetical protein
MRAARASGGVGFRRAWLGALCTAAVALVGVTAPSAQAAFDDPLFVFRPEPVSPTPIIPIPPPAEMFEGPCGLAVDAAGDFYVSDYYHHVVDLFGPGTGYIGQTADEDPLDGPCGLAVDAAGNLYVNNFHRNVIHFAPGFGAATVIAGVGAGPGAEAARPTGVAVEPGGSLVYVDERTRVAVFDSAGATKGTIGQSNLQDGYGVAVSGYPATEGFVYVPDADTETIKVYDPATDTVDPAAEIDGSGTPNGHFTSLRNSAIAVDGATGEIYVADILRPEYSESSETAIYVFDANGVYEGRLKYSIENALPPGLAVDNSNASTKGRVYVTSGNSELGAVYVYPPGAATSAAVPLPGPSTPGGGAAGGGSSSAGALATPAVSPAVVAAPAATDPGVPAAVSTSAIGPGRNPRAAKRARHRQVAKHRAAKSNSRAKKGER